MEPNYEDTSIWKKEYTQDGRPMYINKQTGQTAKPRNNSVLNKALSVSGHEAAAPVAQAAAKSGNVTDWYIQQYTQDKIPFFVHMRTGVSMWSLPEGTPQSAVKFITHLTDNGIPYYENVETGTTSWTLPLDQLSTAARRTSMALKKMNRRQSEHFMNSSNQDALATAVTKKDKKDESSKHGSESGSESRHSSPKPTSKETSQDTTVKSSPRSDEDSAGDKQIIQRRPFGSSPSPTPKMSTTPVGSTQAHAGLNSGTKPLVRTMFEKYDSDADGTLLIEELQELCYDCGVYMTTDELINAMQGLDSNGDGSLLYDEFIVWWRTNPRFSSMKPSDPIMMNRSAAAVIFKRYDPSVSGTMTQQNFRFAQREFVTAGLITCDLEKCMADLDPSGRGSIPFNDFMTWLEETKGAGYSTSKTSPSRSSSGTISRLFGSLMGTKKQEDEGSPVISQVQTSVTPTPSSRKSLTVAKDEPVNDSDFQNMFRKKPSVVISDDEDEPTKNDKYIRVSVKKPLGLTLGENESDGAMGVHVESFSKGGNAAATGLIRPGLHLIEACGINVQRFDFDSIMDILREAPADTPLALVFADPADPISSPTKSKEKTIAVPDKIDTSPTVVQGKKPTPEDKPVSSTPSSSMQKNDTTETKPTRVGSFTSRKAAALKAASSKRIEANNTPPVTMTTENDSDVSETESEESEAVRHNVAPVPALFGVPAHLQGVDGFDVDDEESDGEVSGSTWSTKEGKVSETGSVPSIAKPLYQQKPQEKPVQSEKETREVSSKSQPQVVAAPKSAQPMVDQSKPLPAASKEAIHVDKQLAPDNRQQSEKETSPAAQSGRSSRSLFRGNSLKHMKSKLQKQHSGEEPLPAKDGGVSMVLSRPTMPKRAPATKPHSKVKSDGKDTVLTERTQTMAPGDSSIQSREPQEHATISQPVEQKQLPLPTSAKKARGGIARIDKSAAATTTRAATTPTIPSPIVASVQLNDESVDVSLESGDEISRRALSDIDSMEVEKQARRNNMDSLLSDGISQMKKDIRTLSQKMEKSSDPAPTLPKPRIAQPQRFRDAPSVSTYHSQKSGSSAAPGPDVDSISSNPFFSSLRSEPVVVADVASISEASITCHRQPSFASEASVDRSVKSSASRRYAEAIDMSTQTDYTNVLDDEYLNPYQLLLSEKSEIAHTREQQRIEYEEALQHITDELTLSNAMLDEREAQLVQAIEAHENQLQQRAAALQEAVEEEKRQLDSRWEALRKAERDASTLHAQRVSELLNLAHVLVLHHDKLHTDKKKIARQRYHLDLAMQDMHRFNTFQPNSTHISSPVRWKTESSRHSDAYFVSPSMSKRSPGSPYSPATYTTSPGAKRWVSPGPSTRFSKTAN